MPVFHKLKIQIFMDVTHPRLRDDDGRGSTFPQNVCIYCAPQHIIRQHLNLHLHSCQNQKNSLKCFNLRY